MIRDVNVVVDNVRVCETYTDFTLGIDCNLYDIRTLTNEEFSNTYSDDQHDNASNYFKGVLSNYVCIGVFRCAGDHIIGDDGVVWEEVTPCHLQNGAVANNGILVYKYDSGEMSFTFAPKSNGLLLTKFDSFDFDYSYWGCQCGCPNSEPIRFASGAVARYAFNFGNYFTASDWEDRGLKNDSYSTYENLRNALDRDTVMEMCNYSTVNNTSNGIRLHYHFPVGDNNDGYTYYVQCKFYDADNESFEYFETYISPWVRRDINFGSTYGGSCNIVSQTSSSDTFTPSFSSYVEANRYHIDVNANRDFGTQDITINFDLRKTNDGCNIRPSAGVGGNISPNTRQILPIGASQSFAITPSDGYSLRRVLVDGADDTASVRDFTYTFENLTANHTISAEFEEYAEYRVEVARFPSHGGEVRIDGMTETSATFPKNSTVKIIATPRLNEGWIFDGWYSNLNHQLVSSDSEYVFNLSSDISLTARFSSAFWVASVSASVWSGNKVEVNDNVFLTKGGHVTANPCHVISTPSSDFVCTCLDIDGHRIYENADDCTFILKNNEYELEVKDYVYFINNEWYFSNAGEHPPTTAEEGDFYRLFQDVLVLANDTDFIVDGKTIPAGEYYGMCGFLYSGDEWVVLQHDIMSVFVRKGDISNGCSASIGKVDSDGYFEVDSNCGTVVLENYDSTAYWSGRVIATLASGYTIIRVDESLFVNGAVVATVDVTDRLVRLNDNQYAYETDNALNKKIAVVCKEINSEEE